MKTPFCAFLTAIFLLAFAAPAFGEGISADKEAQTLWRQPVGGIAISEVESAGDFITVITNGGSLTALSKSGKVLWKYKSAGKLLPFYARSARGVSYICRTNGMLIAVNREGAQLWKRKLKAPLAAPPVLGYDGRIFLFMEEKIACLNERGVQLWEKSLSAPLIGEPRPDSNGAFLALLQDNTLIRGSPFGTFTLIKLEGSPFAVLPLQGGGAYRGGAFLVLDKDGLLSIFEGDKLAGTEKLGAPPLAAAVNGAYTAVQLNNKKLVLWSFELWRTKASGVVWAASSPVGVGAPGNPAQEIKIEILLNGGGGKAPGSDIISVCVFSVSYCASFSDKGEELWSLKFVKSAITPSLDSDVLYAGGTDWILYAYKLKYQPSMPQLTPQLRNGSGGNGENAGRGQNVAYELLRAAGAGDLNALNDLYSRDFDSVSKIISAGVREGSIGAREHLWTAYLLKVAAAKAYPLGDRIGALKMLGVFASPEISPALLNILNSENEPSVMSAAVSCLGKIGIDSGSPAMQIFHKLISSHYNESLLLSIADALDEINRYGDPETYKSSLSLLLELSAGNMPRSVRDKAGSTLRTVSSPR